MPKAAELTGQGNPRPRDNKYAGHGDVGFSLCPNGVSLSLIKSFLVMHPIFPF